MTRRALRSKLFPLAVAAAGVLALVASAAWAVIPDPDGTIHACYSRDDGNLRVIDPATSQCKRRENPLQWSAAPAADLPDSFVSRRNDEAQVFPGFTTTILTLDLDPGSHQVAPKLQLSSRDEGQPQRVRCSLDPAEEQGPASDQAELSLAAPEQPGDTGALALFVSQVLNEAGDVVLWCRAVPLGSGATVSFASIRAVEVGSIETEEETVPLP